MYRIIVPSKITEKRGKRSRKMLADLTNGKLTEQDIYGYEKGKWEPSKKKLPYLLQVLECEYEDISEALKIPA